MKYVMQNGALFSLSEKNWKSFCKNMAAGEEFELPGKMLEFDLIEISKWDREDYAKAVNIEVPSDLPTTETKVPTKGRAVSKRSKVNRSSGSKRAKTT